MINTPNKILQMTGKLRELGIPTHCPSCGHPLKWEGVELVCDRGQGCPAQSLQRVESFLLSCGVENVTETSLRNWGIINFETLISFRPDVNYKTHVNFCKELKDKVYSKSGTELFSHMVFAGAAKKTIDKILNHYKIKSFENLPVFVSAFDWSKLPEGVGERTLIKLQDDWVLNHNNVRALCRSRHYAPVVTNKPAGGKLNSKSFLITGTLSKPRKFFEDLIVSKGGVVASGVSKSLDYLIVGSDAGGKLDKAKKLGIKIISESELMGIL